MKVRILSVVTLSLFLNSSLFGWQVNRTYAEPRPATPRVSRSEPVNLSGEAAMEYLKKEGISKSVPTSTESLFSQDKKIRSSPPVNLANFGNSVDIDGDTAIVGAYFEGSASPGPRGAAYIFERNAGGANNWGQVKRLTATNPTATTVFGPSVAINGDTAIVSSAGEFAVYVFERNAGGPNNWGQAKKLSSSGFGLVEGIAGFPRLIDIEGDTIVAGSALSGPPTGQTVGAVYVFERNAGGANNWGEVKKILRSDGQVSEFFGTTVSISGGTIVATAYGDDIGGNTDQGSAYVFERDAGGANNWGEVKKLTASDGTTNGHFGYAAARVNGNTIVVGAAFDATSRGSVYVFERNEGGADNWGEVKKLTDPAGLNGDLFGQDIAISGDKMLVGERAGDNGTIVNTGAVFIFERNRGGADNWGQSQRLTDTDGDTSDGFGMAVALSGKTAIIGALNDQIGAENFDQGSALIFSTQNVSWNVDAQPLPANCTADDRFGWSVSVDGDTAVVGAPYTDVGASSNAGAAYIFYRDLGGANNWGLAKTIVSPGPAAGDNFGWSVTISGDHIFVGAPYWDNLHPNMGLVVGFKRNNGGPDNWDSFFSTFGSQPDDFAGWSVAASGDTLISGSPGDDIGSNSNQGSARITQFDTQQQFPPIIFTKTITAADGATGDAFGFSVSINSDTAVVTANSDDNGANPNQGAAYVFDRDNGGANNWGQAKKLSASDGAADDFFGTSTSVSGDTVVIGAVFKRGTNTNQGAAYVFSRNAGGVGNWGEVKKLTQSDGAAFDNFGISVSVSGDSVVVGAWFDVISDSRAQGSAYIFKQNAGGADNWGQIKKLVSADGTSYDYFGKSVALDDGSTLLVGATNDEIGGTLGLGSAYVFKDNGADWIEQAKPLPPLPTDCGSDDNYGYSVSIDGDTAVIGANKDDIGVETNQGAVYVLDRNEGGANNWGLVKVLLASDGETDDYFGHSVSIKGNLIVVGAPYKTEGANAEQGAAYVFERNYGGTNYWGEVKKLTASDASGGDRFGWDVAVSGSTVVVGAPLKNSDLGAAYVFEKNAGGADNWGETKKLFDPEGAGFPFFGWSVAVNGYVVMVGAPYGNSNAGSAQIFERNAGGANNWGRTKVLTASDGAADDEFGWDVSVNGNLVVTSADGDDGSGSAYIFDRNQGGANNWGQVKKIRALDPGDGDRFGYSVSVFEGSVIVGSAADDVGANENQGSAYIFEQHAGGTNNWGQVKKLIDPNGAVNSWFGNAVAISGDDFLIGAYLAIVNQTPAHGKSANLFAPVQQGTGYVFRGASLAPTAANVSISGRVMTADGSGISKARVSLAGANGETRTVLTNLLGYYRIEGVPVGETYILFATHRIYQFDTRVVGVFDEITDLDFTAAK